MPKRRWMIAGLALAAALSLSAGEPWISKPYQSWDQKDVRKILNSSPWAQTVQIMAPWQRTSRVAEFSGRGPVGRAPGEPDYPSGPAASDASQPSPGLPPGATLARAPYAPVVVRWASSSTARIAAAREKALEGLLRAGEVDEEAARKPEEYEIVLVFDAVLGMPPVRRFEMEENAFLTLKPSGRRIAASRVEVRGNAGSNGGEVSFYFPRYGEDGRPQISPEQTEVQFQCEAGGMVALAKFQPQKMLSKSGLDL